VFKYSRLDIEMLSKETDFKKDNLEKVLRLIDILKFIDSKEVFNPLKLKGGTALQLAVFNFKRLSVDIDFDFHINEDKDNVQKKRDEIKDFLKRYMDTEGYTLSERSRISYSLDSFVFKYKNLRGNDDNIKIDINYTNRIHVLEPTKFEYKSAIFGDFNINMLSELELFATKINALIVRTVPRDFYDTFLIVRDGLVSKKDYELLKKIIVFYYVLSNHDTSLFESIENLKNNLDRLGYKEIKKSLIPVLNKNDKFDSNIASNMVMDFLNEVLVLTEKEKDFIDCSKSSEFRMELLFSEEFERLNDHPRIKWLIQNKNN